MDERNLKMLERYEDQLTEMLTLIGYLHHEGELKHFDAGDYRALEAVREAISIEVGQHRADA